jgi:hypothetical protein
MGSLIAQARKANKALKMDVAKQRAMPLSAVLVDERNYFRRSICHKKMVAHPGKELSEFP